MPRELTNTVKRILPMWAQRQVRNYRLAQTPTQKVLDAWHEALTEEDVFLVSYPRSGNTWTRYLLTNLRFPEASWSMRALDVVFPYLYDDIDIQCVPRPRWIKSHYLPASFCKRVIYLVRDGRDVAASFFHWSGRSSDYEFREYLREFILDEQNNPQQWGTWHRHVLEWLRFMKGQDALVVRYEDLLADPQGELQRLCRFLRMERSATEIETAMERSTVSRIQSDFRDHRQLATQKVGLGGGTGKHREYFDQELLEEFDRVAGKAMAALGYESGTHAPDAEHVLQDM